MVFSAGAELSPTNRTHVHEMDLAEFKDLLAAHFRTTRIWGMRFRQPERRAAQARMAQHAVDGYRLFGERWWNLAVSRAYIF